MTRWGWLALLLSTPLAAQQIVEYSAYSGPLALGYPVPEPIESLTPVAGFRSLESLQARHQSLYLESPWVRAELLGQSRQGRDIWAYRLSDADSRTSGGLAEPAVLFSATLHAREWQAPEVLTGLFESLLDSAGDTGVGQFLLENLEVLLVPLVNPDGLAHTQRYATRTVLVGTNSYRDGRQRRKNLRDNDGILETLDDYLLGVDLNRHFPPFWGQGGSASSGSIQYRGAAALSEPEALALVVAVDADTATRLRLYADFHSFGRQFIVPETDRPVLDSFNRGLVGKLQAHLQALGSGYAAQYWPRSAGIGATDEYHAETHLIPAWTFEIEPGAPGAAEYGGFGVRNDGFILPAAEIARVRQEIDSTYRLALYHQYGPPTLVAALIQDVANDQPVYSARWQAQDDSLRQLQILRDGPLQPQRQYRLWLAFDKPMRQRLDGVVSNYPGQSVALAASIALGHPAGQWSLPVSIEHWLEQPGGAPDGYQRYRDDALALSFSTPAADWLSEPLTLQVTVADMAGLALDSEPASPVGFAAGWSGYQPGTDTSLVINANGILLWDGFEASSSSIPGTQE